MVDIGHRLLFFWISTLFRYINMLYGFYRIMPGIYFHSAENYCPVLQQVMLFLGTDLLIFPTNNKYIDISSKPVKKR